MSGHPDAATLLDLVERTLKEEIVPALGGVAAYRARVAASLVATVARELRLGRDTDDRERYRLRALLGSDAGDLDALNRLLADRLRDGTLSPADPAVAEHLRRTALDRLAIDGPGYPRVAEMRERQ